MYISLDTDLSVLPDILHLGIIVLIPMNGFSLLYEFFGGHNALFRVFKENSIKTIFGIEVLGAAPDYVILLTQDTFLVFPKRVA